MELTDTCGMSDQG